MRIAALSGLALLLSSASMAQTATSLPPDLKKDLDINIQSPIKTAGAVDVADEPHHAHVFQNGYVQVYNVTVPPLDATLLHRHDLPYIYLTLGDADIVNEIEGKSPVQMTLQDGATRYTPGGFAHIARTPAGSLFHNITMVLEHPQESPHNLGENAQDRPLGSCPPSTSAAGQNFQIPSEQLVPCFESNEVRLELVRVEGGKDFVQASPETSALLVAMSNANLDVALGGEHAAFMHAGDVLWLPAKTARRVGDFLGTRSQFLLLSFKDSGAAPAQ